MRWWYILKLTHDSRWFATLERGLDASRLRSSRTDGATIVLLPGMHHLHATVELEPRDIGLEYLITGCTDTAVTSGRICPFHNSLSLTGDRW